MAARRRFEDLLAELKTRRTKGLFSPCAIYNRDGDTLEVYLSRDSYLAERVDTL